MVHHGVTRAKGAAFKKDARNRAMVISSYALLHRDYEILAGLRWDGVVLDEAQNIKNPKPSWPGPTASFGSDRPGTSRCTRSCVQERRKSESTR